MAQIELNKVAKHFGDKAVIPSLDLTIEDNEFVVFVGPSGCGKSTLLRLIAGLEDVTAGTIRIDGNDATTLPPAKRGLAMVFQSYALYPHMTVRQNIGFPLRMAGMKKAEIRTTVEQAANTLNLSEYLDVRPAKLSGGQRQRVAIGRAIVRQPSGFLFDEPLSNLDAALRVTMRGEITDMHRALDTTMIYVTHDQVEAMTMAQKIVVLRAGVIEQVGAPRALYHQPQNTFVAQFIGSPKMNLLEGQMAEKYRAHTVGIRPENLRIGADGDIEGKVLGAEHLGAYSFLRIGVEGIGELVIRDEGDSVIALDDTIKVALHGNPDQSVHRFDAQGMRMGA